MTTGAYSQSYRQAEIDAYKRGQRDMRRRLLAVAARKTGLWCAEQMEELIRAATIGEPPSSEQMTDDDEDERVSRRPGRDIWEVHPCAGRCGTTSPALEPGWVCPRCARRLLR